MAGQCRGGWVGIAAGASHSCALQADGSLHCFGLNGVGQLGVRGPQARSTPTRATATTRAVRVDAGRYFGCALDGLGVLRCWGELAGVGKVGRPGSGLEVLRDVRDFALGDEHGCAILGDGTLRCFGSNVRGQLGVGHAEPLHEPGAAVADLQAVRAVACGATHSCALDGQGQVRCWGLNAHGQLGEGNREDRFAPGPPPSTETWTRLAAGGNHTCASAADGALHCWGANGSGQLGLGDARDRDRPARVGLADVAELALGAHHSCARTRDGSLRCWGLGAGGRLGLGDELDHGLPDAVLALPASLAVAVGEHHGCALSTDGALRCWGVNDGQLGNGTFSAEVAPVTVVPPTAPHP